MGAANKLFSSISLLSTTTFRRSLSTGGILKAIQNVTIIGAGTMGAGIAQVSAAAGNSVRLVDVNEKVLDNSKKTIETSLGRIVKKLFKDDPSKGTEFCKKTISRITFMTEKEKSVESADLVIEAIIENLKLKQDLFAALDVVAPQKTIFASNTSAIPIKEISKTTNRKDRFGGLHFFSPVPMMKLLEVIRTPETSDETYKTMISWGKAVGKITVCCKDTPGFIVNRLMFPYIMDAVRMVERGDATPQDIDLAMKYGGGYPMGPFELSDAVGVDIGFYIGQGWEKMYPNNPQFKVPELLKKLVKEGKLGRKTGEGWYKYGDKK